MVFRVLSADRIKRFTLPLMFVMSGAYGNEADIPQLLQTYFDANAVCSTATVTAIVEDPKSTLVELDIEKNTRAALNGMLKKNKDDWFSLHCPPENHQVWKTDNAPADIEITGLLDEGFTYRMSCVQYQAAAYKRFASIQSRIAERLNKLLSK